MGNTLYEKMNLGKDSKERDWLIGDIIAKIKRMTQNLSSLELY
jgi:hypothetical protein